MATSAKIDRTGTFHPLPFEQLSPLDFERLCLGLVIREGFERAEHLGAAGGDSGRDVMAWKGDRRWIFQCKRVQKFTAADGKKEIAKLLSLPGDQRPDELVFVMSRTLSAPTRKALRAEWGDEATCHFWTGSELEARVNLHPDLRELFFQLPAAPLPASFRHNLPFASLRGLFQGREEILATLRGKLAEGKRDGARVVAITAVHGLGGVGKSRISIEYGWRYASKYTAVLFVGASTPSELQRNVAALTHVLDLQERETKDKEIQGAAVVRRLGEVPGWLLILDNVDTKDAAAAAGALVARLHGGDVLLTGRLAHWGAEVEPIEVNVLEEGAAVTFLLGRTEGRRRSTKNDAEQAAMLAREVGSLPLALEQAAAYISERKRTFSEYLEEWRWHHDRVLEWFDPQVSHYPASVAITWQTSFDRLTAPARRLLERLAWLGSEPIPDSLLDVSIPGLSESEGIADPHGALVDLATYSLVTRSPEKPTFTVHRLVQDVTRRSLRNVSDPGPLHQALRWVNAAFVGDPQDVRTWPTLDPLSPHARAVVAFTDSAGITDPTARLMNNLAQLYNAKALLAEAEPLMRRSLAIVEGSLGENHPNVATALNNLAQLLQATNRLAEAEPLMRRALAIDEGGFGADHPSVARDLNNLALLLQATNRLAEAEPLMERVVAILDKGLGENHPNVGAALNNLAQLLKATNRVAEAEPLMRRVLAIDEGSFGAEHPEVATDLNNLAQLLQDTDRLVEAEPLMRRALAIVEESFGADHPNVAIRLNNLAALLQARDRLGEAEPLMRRALAIFFEFERQTGFEHPNGRVVSGNYRRLLEEMGKSEAEIEAAFAALPGRG